jgi:hypothetical protein
VRKVVDQSDVTSGDPVVFTLVVDNAGALTQSAQLKELLPGGFTMDPDYPSPPFDPGTQQWTLSVPPGGLELLSVMGTVVGLDRQVLTNTAQLWQGPTLVGQASAAVRVHAPVIPQLSLFALYPNPAPGAATWGPWAHIVYDASVDMPIAADIYTVAGERVRHLDGAGAQNLRGRHQLDWDLTNAYGRRVASGVFLVRVYTTADLQPSPQAVGFLAVIR